MIGIGIGILFEKMLESAPPVEGPWTWDNTSMTFDNAAYTFDGGHP